MPAAPAAGRDARPRSGPRVTPARACAFAVVRRVFERDAWADRALLAEAERARLEGRDRALATQLAYGTVQRRLTIDHVLEALAGRPVAEIEPGVLAALRLGLFQIVWLDRIPAHAAVGESVELAKGASPAAAGFVNAVLRRAAREARGMVAALGDETPEAAALRHSHPEWVARLWFGAFGAQTARALMAAGNEPAETALRANALTTERAALLEALGPAARPAGGPPALPEAVLLDAAFDAHGHPGFGAGAFMPQSRAAMAVSRILAPRPGERVLDLCAAPGGKTTHLAALLEGTGEVVAVERHPGRADALRRTAARMRAPNVRVHVGDAAAFAEPGAYDRVLVDPPCSDLGTLRSRPDARWRKDAEQPARLARLQGEILRAGAAALRPGGTLVYSTCTISPAENEEAVAGFLDAHPDFSADDLQADHPVWEHPRVDRHLQTLPHRDGTDGFFIARLRREAPARG